MSKHIIQKKANDYDCVASSYHESGHVICGLYNFSYIPSVHLLNHPHYDQGVTWFFDYDIEDVESKRLFNAFIFFDLETTFAGLVAERMYYKYICGSDKFPMHLKRGSYDDMAYISKQIRKLGLASPGEETKLLKKRIENDTIKIISENWEAVRIIAHYLYKKKNLTFKEIKHILTTKGDNRQFWKDRFKKIKTIHGNVTPEEHIVKKLIKE